MKKSKTDYKEFNRKVYDYAKDIASSPLMLFLLGAWAFLEGSIWFIIPDFLLLSFIVLSPEDYKKMFLITLLSSIAGTIAYFIYVNANLEAAHSLLLNTPFINNGMLLRIDSMYAAQGVTSVLSQSFSGIPIKVWTYAAAKNGISFSAYILFVSISRALRMLLVSFFGFIIGTQIKRQIRDNFVMFLVAFAALFLLIIKVMKFLYMLYF